MLTYGIGRLKSNAKNDLIVEMNVYHPAVFSSYLRERSEWGFEP